ncbi:MAG: hypothetical protein FWD98_07255 [Defluviitaleaceae bacterium]|nr:hypothetical protein [Defluviitaleaceae bacterium]
MEVKNAQNLQRTRQPATGGSPAAAEHKNEVRAKIVDIRRDAVTIKTSTGTLITGRLAADSAGIDARIGETHTFTATRGEGGELILSLHAKGYDVRNSIAIKDALASIGITANTENTNIARLLLENQTPVTRENMLAMSRGERLMGAGMLERVLFFMEHDMPITPRLTASLDAVLSGQFKIGAQLAELVQGLGEMGAGGAGQGAVEQNSMGQKLTAILLHGQSALTQAELAAQLADTATAKIARPGGVQQADGVLVQAFANHNMQEPGATQLSQRLYDALPEMRVQVASAAQARTEFVQAAEANREQILALLNSSAAAGDADTARLALSLRQIMQGAGAAVFENTRPLFVVSLAVATLFAGDEAQAARMLNSLGLGRGEPAPSGASNTPEALMQKLSFVPNGGVSLAEYMDGYLNETRANFELARSVLAQSGETQTTAGAKVMSALAAICDNLDFVAQMRNNFYAQIPLMAAGDNTGAELYVFRDKHKKDRTGGYVSALVAIDTSGMGRFEAYVLKQGRALSCQFRLESEDVRRHVAEHLSELGTALEALDYRLEAVSYRETDEAFTLLHKEPQTDGAKVSFSEIKRASLDIRV